MNTKNQQGTINRSRRWASLQDAADYVSVHPKTLTRRFSDGTLTRYRIGRRIMVDLDELDTIMLASASGLKTLPRQRTAGN